jgi:hypothetical protein
MGHARPQPEGEPSAAFGIGVCTALAPLVDPAYLTGEADAPRLVAGLRRAVRRRRVDHAGHRAWQHERHGGHDR